MVGGIMQIGTSLGAMGASALGSYSEAVAYNMALRYQQHIALRNRDLAQFQARESIYLGDQAAAQYDRQVEALVGSQRAAAAASGVLVGAGSAGEAQARARATGERGIQIIKKNAEKTAWGHMVAAANWQSQWNIYRTQKRNVFLSTLSGALGGSGGLASGIGNVAGGM
jgi:hypothetical protein